MLLISIFKFITYFRYSFCIHSNIFKMEDSDEEQEKEVIYPPYVVRVNDMDIKMMKQLIYCIDYIYNNYLESDIFI